MNIISLPVACLSAVAFSVGFYYIWFFLRKKTGKEDLFFALACFSTALYDAFCFLLYNASTLEEGMFWQRLQFASIALMSISMMWFVFYFVGYKKKIYIYLFSLWFGLLFVLGLVVQNSLTLSPANSITRNVKLGHWAVITYHEASPGPIYQVEYISLVAGFIFIFYVIARYRKRGFRRHTFPFLVALLFFFITAVNDVLVGMAFYPFIYLTEYAFMLIIVSMAYVLQNSFLNLYHEVRNLNLTLEEKVRDRTEELQGAMEELEAVNEQLISTNKALEEAQQIARIDMNMAVNIQRSMLPDTVPSFSHWDIAYAFIPMSGVSGDFYDFYIEDNQLRGVSLFDVSGHGVSSGLITLLSKSILTRLFFQSADMKLGALMEEVNRELSSELLNVDNYLCGVMLRIHDSSVEYVNAGSPDLVLRQASSGRTVRVRSQEGLIRGLPLGIKGADPNYDSLKFPLERGDVILLYTDGFQECVNPDGVEFGLEGVKESLRSAPAGGADNILQDLMDSFDKHRGNAAVSDDVSVVVLKKI